MSVQTNKVKRPWGYYRVLHEVSGMKVKELSIEPGQKISMQKHEHRSEYWIVSEGQCVVYGKSSNGNFMPLIALKKHDSLKINLGEWHQLANPHDKPCRVVEIQYGSKCEESDIQRHE